MVWMSKVLECDYCFQPIRKYHIDSAEKFDGMNLVFHRENNEGKDCLAYFPQEAGETFASLRQLNGFPYPQEEDDD